MERCNYEDDVSAKKIEAQPRARLYEENEDQKRQKGSGQKTGQGQSTAFSLKTKTAPCGLKF